MTRVTEHIRKFAVKKRLRVSRKFQSYNESTDQLDPLLMSGRQMAWPVAKLKIGNLLLKNTLSFSISTFGLVRLLHTYKPKIAPLPPSDHLMKTDLVMWLQSVLPEPSSYSVLCSLTNLELPMVYICRHARAWSTKLYSPGYHFHEPIILV